MGSFELLITAEEKYRRSVLDILAHQISLTHLEENKSKRIIDSLDHILQEMIKTNVNHQSYGDIKVSFKEKKDKIEIQFENHSFPIFFSKNKWLDSGNDVVFENCGRLGQKIVFSIKKKIDFIESLQKSDPEKKSCSEIVVELLKPEEAFLLSELFYQVYRYRYINEYVYYPEKLEKMIREERLISMVAKENSHKLIGHIGLVRCGENPPVYDIALGVVDPQYKGVGLFGKIYERVVEEMGSIPMSYCIYDFVTNHEFSQKKVAKYGYCDMALCLGSQVSETQAKLEEMGIGIDSKEMNRYTLLIAIQPKIPIPFGSTVVLPANIGEVCSFLLQPLNMNWIPSSRFSTLSAEGKYQKQFLQEQKSIIFDFYQPGRKALEHLIEEWQIYMKEGYQYFGVDVPLNYSGIGQLYDILAAHGFFFSGFIPYHFSNQLGFRFQFLLPNKVDFDGIKIFSETGKQLLKIVKENYERNSIL